MAKAPGRAVDFDGAGNVWFKIFEITAHPDPTGQQYPTFPSSGSHALYSLSLLTTPSQECTFFGFEDFYEVLWELLTFYLDINNSTGQLLLVSLLARIVSSPSHPRSLLIDYLCL